MVDLPDGALMSIGDFAQRTRLTPKALRIYDRTGLLRPAAVDQNTHYRRYGVSQVRVGQLIAALRGADINLAEIRLILDDLSTSGDAAADRLDRLLSGLDRSHADRRVLIRHVQTTLRQGGNSMFPIDTRHVPGRRVMSIQRRLHASETDRFVRRAKAAFAEHLHGSKATGPFSLIFHGVVSDDADGPLEAILGCPETIRPTELIGVRTEPAHDEAYTTITKAQWAYPAILAAYDAVACCAEVMSRPGSRLSCREVYRADPDGVGDDEIICDIAFPLAAK
jgi:DNA-binding transcriptional MerR regulator